jgi:regulator of RNase E activity RraB
MTDNHPYFVITFPSVHHAIKLESKLKGNDDISIRLVPVPREISSSCGVAAKINDAEVGKIIKILSKNGMEYDCIYLYEKPKQKPILVDQH